MTGGLEDARLALDAALARLEGLKPKEDAARAHADKLGADKRAAAREHAETPDPATAKRLRATVADSAEADATLGALAELVSEAEEAIRAARQRAEPLERAEGERLHREARAAALAELEAAREKMTHAYTGAALAFGEYVRLLNSYGDSFERTSAGTIAATLLESINASHRAFREVGATYGAAAPLVRLAPLAKL